MHRTSYIVHTHLLSTSPTTSLKIECRDRAAVKKSRRHHSIRIPQLDRSRPSYRFTHNHSVVIRSGLLNNHVVRQHPSISTRYWHPYEQSVDRVFCSTKISTSTSRWPIEQLPWQDLVLPGRSWLCGRSVDRLVFGVDLEAERSEWPCGLGSECSHRIVADSRETNYSLMLYNASLA
jgi:hypothetical protein